MFVCMRARICCFAFACVQRECRGWGGHEMATVHTYVRVLKLPLHLLEDGLHLPAVACQCCARHTPPACRQKGGSPQELALVRIACLGPLPHASPTSEKRECRGTRKTVAVRDARSIAPVTAPRRTHRSSLVSHRQRARIRRDTDTLAHTFALLHASRRESREAHIGPTGCIQEAHPRAPLPPLGPPDHGQCIPKTSGAQQHPRLRARRQVRKHDTPCLVRARLLTPVPPAGHPRLEGLSAGNAEKLKAAYTAVDLHVKVCGK
jgi:hypothetical protein